MMRGGGREVRAQHSNIRETRIAFARDDRPGAKEIPVRWLRAQPSPTWLNQKPVTEVEHAPRSRTGPETTARSESP